MELTELLDSVTPLSEKYALNVPPFEFLQQQLLSTFQLCEQQNAFARLQDHLTAAADSYAVRVIEQDDLVARMHDRMFGAAAAITIALATAAERMHQEMKLLQSAHQA